MPRKTISVDAVKEMINRHIALSTDPDFRQERRAVASVLATILLDTGNYRGFSYLDSPYEAGVTDQSRVHYY